ncbi:GHKL domain-containing protein [Companilactobacillus crustorum]|uniref:GHKL domain-containing protein n=1 Tax=Companilactobacillus crustorum TaxID=392416 RepID=UPI000957AAFB|nr:GHKL domain-containing protein [Companilactobacillus crustorum]APU72450.1 hypothetical protein BI355_2156 [Companilactobacillus crustorum]WDT65513.1 GHKL domain-containing protein [Companilactobacillus crustorum]HCD08339.1 GHKL domain-containing protein [Lactobacillus sp.]
MGPHLLRIFLAWIIFYYIFNLIYHSDLSPKYRIGIYSFLTVISVVINILLAGYGFIFIALAIYFCLWPKRSNNYYLINIILLNFLVKFFAIIIPSPVLMHFYPHPNTTTYEMNLIIVLVEFIFSVAFVYFYNFFKLNNFFQSRRTAMTSILLAYIYIIFYMFLLFMQHFQAYEPLIIGIFFLILLQCLFIIIIFSVTRRRQKKVFQDQFSEEQVKNLKLYTDQLEHDQLKLRHFKHDYKNLLFSLKTVADDKDYQAMISALDKLENYFDDYLNNLSMDLYKDLNNVKNPYLKSLFISKLNKINHYHIRSFFNCSEKLDSVPINIFDLVKLLNQAIDNAILFTKRQEAGKIQLAITKEDRQLAFLINNTVANLPTTEREQDYLDLLNIKNLKKKYPNLFIQYSKNDKWFRFHITLITQGDKK